MSPERRRRRVSETLRRGWTVSHNRVERQWREEGMHVPGEQHNGRREILGGSEKSCVRHILHEFAMMEEEAAAILPPSQQTNWRERASLDRSTFLPAQPDGAVLES